MKKISLIFNLLIACGCSLWSQTITIGSQVWMSNNLDVATFRNGDPIPEVETDEEWQKAAKKKQPAWCYYKNDSANGTHYGKLYNWYAVNDSRGLAPVGYHIPSDAEWMQLINYIGGIEVAGNKMKNTIGWAMLGSGNNASGLKCLAGGYRYTRGKFNYIGYYGSWWSSTESYKGLAWDCNLFYYSKAVLRAFHRKGKGLSVRCLRD